MKIISIQGVDNEVMDAAENLFSVAQETNASGIEASLAISKISIGAENQTQKIHRI